MRPFGPEGWAKAPPDSSETDHTLAWLLHPARPRLNSVGGAVSVFLRVPGTVKFENLRE